MLIFIPGIRCFGHRHHVSSYDIHAIWNKVGGLFAILFQNCSIADLTVYTSILLKISAFPATLDGWDNEPLF